PPLKAVAELDSRTTALEEKLQALDQQYATARQQEALFTEFPTRLWYVIQLREAVNHSLPFGQELDAFTAQLTPKEHEQLHAPLAVLTPYAAEGIPSLTSLQEEFEAMAEEVTRQQRAGKENPSLTDQLLLTFPKLIKIRKVDGTTGNTIED